ncbi:unnamed protein product [Calypogeia fissa]
MELVGGSLLPSGGLVSASETPCRPGPDIRKAKMAKNEEFQGTHAPPDPGAAVVKLETCERRRPGGGWITTPFIFGCEASERLAGSGAYMNLITFLTDQMHMGNLSAATLLNTFMSFATVTALMGAFVADAYLGRFKTIAFGSWINLTVSSSK